MKSAHIAAMILAAGFLVAVLSMLRSSHIYIRHAVFWVAAALAVFMTGVFPGAVDHVGSILGISYPPILIALAAVLVLLIKSLESDLAMSRMERRIRRLTQHIAMLEERVRDSEKSEHCEKDF